MKLCDKDHDEICFEEKDCPMCVLLYKIDMLEGQISKVEDENNSLYQMAKERTS